MSTRTRALMLAGALLGGAISAPAAMAQVSSPGTIAPATTGGPAPSASQITAFSRAIGVNETCIKGFIAANGTLPQSLAALNQFMITAPAADLCAPEAVASAMNNTPAPSDTQIAAYAQTAGVSQACVKAFVLHANALPQSPAEFAQFKQAAPPSDQCSGATTGQATTA